MAAPVVANVYKGTYTGNSNTNITLPASVSMSNTIVLCSYSYGVSTTATDHWHNSLMSLVSSTQIVFNTRVNEPVVVRWTVIEFTSGVTVQHLTGSVTGDGSSPSTADATITAVTLSEAFHIAGIEWGSAYFNPSKTDYSKFTSTTNIRSYLNTSDTGTYPFTGQVIEWDDATVTAADFTLSSTTDTFTVSSHTDNKSLIIADQHANRFNVIGQWDFSATTTLRARRGNSSSYNGHYQLIEMDGVLIQRGYRNQNSTTTSDTFTITAVSDVDKSFAGITYNYPTGAGDASTSDVQAATVRHSFNSTTQVAAVRGAHDSEQVDYTWNVIEFDINLGPIITQTVSIIEFVSGTHEVDVIGGATIYHEVSTNIYQDLTHTVSIPICSSGTFPNDWGRKCELTITASMIKGDESNFNVYVGASGLPSEIFNTLANSGAMDTGYDIRFTLDSSGTQLLNFELVDFDKSTISNTEFHVQVPTITSGTAESFYVWYNRDRTCSWSGVASEIWSDYLCVYHMNQAVASGMYDSAPSGYDLSATGSSLVSTEDTVLGKNVDWTASDSYMGRDVTDVALGLTAFTLEAVTYLDNGSVQDKGIFNTTDQTASNDDNGTIQIRYDDVGADTSTNDTFKFTVNTTTDGLVAQESRTANIAKAQQWQYVGHKWDSGNDWDLFVDNTILKATNPGDMTSSTVPGGSLNEGVSGSNDGIYLGRGPKDEFIGKIAEVRLRKSYQDDHYVETNYHNLLDPDFLTAGTPEDAFTGEGVDYTTTPSFIEFDSQSHYVTTRTCVELVRSWTNALNFDVPAGINRALVVHVGLEQGLPGDSLTLDISYGGVPLTRINDVYNDDGGNANYAYCYYLTESGMLNASGTNLDVNFSGTPNKGFETHSAFYQNVYQLDPIVDHAENSGYVSSTQTTPAITTGAGSMAIYVACNGNSSISYTPNNGFTTQLVRDSSSFNVNTADKFSSSSTETPSVSVTPDANRWAMLAYSLRCAAEGVDYTTTHSIVKLESLSHVVGISSLVTQAASTIVFEILNHESSGGASHGHTIQVIEFEAKDHTASTGASVDQTISEVIHIQGVHSATTGASVASQIGIVNFVARSHTAATGASYDQTISTIVLESLTHEVSLGSIYNHTVSTVIFEDLSHTAKTGASVDHSASTIIFNPITHTVNIGSNYSHSIGTIVFESLTHTISTGAGYSPTTGIIIFQTLTHKKVEGVDYHHYICGGQFSDAFSDAFLTVKCRSIITFITLDHTISTGAGYSPDTGIIEFVPGDHTVQTGANYEHSIDVILFVPGNHTVNIGSIYQHASETIIFVSGNHLVGTGINIVHSSSTVIFETLNHTVQTGTSVDHSSGIIIFVPGSHVVDDDDVKTTASIIVFVPGTHIVQTGSSYQQSNEIIIFVPGQHTVDIDEFVTTVGIIEFVPGQHTVSTGASYDSSTGIIIFVPGQHQGSGGSSYDHSISTIIFQDLNHTIETGTVVQHTSETIIFVSGTHTIQTGASYDQSINAIIFVPLTHVASTGINYQHTVSVVIFKDLIHVVNTGASYNHSINVIEFVPGDHAVEVVEFVTTASIIEFVPGTHVVTTGANYTTTASVIVFVVGSSTGGGGASYDHSTGTIIFETLNHNVFLGLNISQNSSTIIFESLSHVTTTSALIDHVTGIIEFVPGEHTSDGGSSYDHSIEIVVFESLTHTIETSINIIHTSEIIEFVTLNHIATAGASFDTTTGIIIFVPGTHRANTGQEIFLSAGIVEFVTLTHTASTGAIFNHQITIIEFLWLSHVATGGGSFNQNNGIIEFVPGHHAIDSDDILTTASVIEFVPGVHVVSISGSFTQTAEIIIFVPGSHNAGQTIYFLHTTSIIEIVTLIHTVQTGSSFDAVTGVIIFIPGIHDIFAGPKPPDKEPGYTPPDRPNGSYIYPDRKCHLITHCVVILPTPSGSYVAPATKTGSYVAPDRVVAKFN